MKIRVAEVYYDDEKVEYHVVASSDIQARDLLVKHLAKHDWKSINVRDTSGDTEGPARVIGKIDT